MKDGHEFSRKMSAQGQKGGLENAKKFTAKRLQVQQDYLFNLGMTAPQLAEKHKIPVSTAYAYMREVRPPLSQNNLPHPQLEELLQAIKNENDRMSLLMKHQKTNDAL
jgi:predicted transcriptional regulator